MRVPVPPMWGRACGCCNQQTQEDHWSGGRGPERHITAGCARTQLGRGTLSLWPRVFGLRERRVLWLSRKEILPRGSIARGLGCCDLEQAVPPVVGTQEPQLELRLQGSMGWGWGREGLQSSSQFEPRSEMETQPPSALMWRKPAPSPPRTLLFSLSQGLLLILAFKAPTIFPESLHQRTPPFSFFPNHHPSFFPPRVCSGHSSPKIPIKPPPRSVSPRGRLPEPCCGA